MKSKLENIKKQGFDKLIARLDPEKYYINGEDIRIKGDFYENQTRLVLRNCGIIDPAAIEEYIGLD